MIIITPKDGAFSFKRAHDAIVSGDWSGAEHEKRVLESVPREPQHDLYMMRWDKETRTFGPIEKVEKVNP